MIDVHILNKKKISGTKSSLRSPLARLYPTESDTLLQHCKLSEYNVRLQV